ncbi:MULTISPECIES: ArsR/SmtB family transcription factor [Actinomycetes]|uniref:ArsR family transcriptional regulator n=2 Tax=Glutamicibacter TaxID=1742989 RepID=A0A2N7S6K7_9MICC|nr:MULTISPECIES: winged helix-turn-helix domain-containing protein [Actinomycetes]HBV11180.1 ArsR family transcriptional regulator [Micrococcaceae bacterium]OKX85535.1 transcriptional regulator [Corynebacterium glutamicum]PCC33141.1 ArsR family transcriptional regulator [Glutamicibacter sp. BW77]PMQ21778.1 ArsR family transcriptional regulator [Glutamicibacter arilaitensis]QDX76358.1 ArsR family transcriptional regulator [Corynebacterium glutamicum]
MDAELLAQTLSALGSAPRLRIIASLKSEPTHVSELARRLRMSRPLLYQHLNRLEAAGLVESDLEQTGENRLKKHYWVTQFAFEITPDLIDHIVHQRQEEEPS